MPVVNLSSTIVTNHNATPLVQNAVTVDGGRRRSIGTFITVSNGDSIASTYRLMRIMSHARIISINMKNNAITSGAANLGLSRVTADGGAVVSAACYAAAISIATAMTNPGTELCLSARTLDKIGQNVWADAGLTADSRVPYDLVLTLTAAATGTGFIAFEVVYAID